MFNLQLPLPPPPPPPQPVKQKLKPKIKILTIIPVVIIIVSVVGAFYFSGFFNDFGSAPNNGSSPSNTASPSQGAIATAPPLTPARDIEGTWVTTFSTEFTIATDFQNFGTLEDVGSDYRTMTWTITPTQDENTVYVEISFTVSNSNLIDGSGYTPDVSPMELTGIINGTQLTLTRRGSQGPIEQVDSVGVFTFTSIQMEGTWHDHWTGVYEQNVYTQTNGLKLMKQ